MHNLPKFIIPLFALAFLLVGCGKTETPATPASSDTSASSTDATASSVARPITFDGVLLTGKHTVVLKTSKGDVTIELNADAAPKAATNFAALAKSGYYNGLTFHRVIPSFMIQGGDPDGNGKGGVSVFGATFEDEINAQSYGLDKKSLSDLAKDQPIPDELKNLTLQQYYEKQGYTYNDKLQSLPLKRGSVAMANRGPNTNGSQFFIVQGDNLTWLEGKYTVFGTVTSGMEAVDAIAGVERDQQDKPLEPITFTAEVKN